MTPFEVGYRRCLQGLERDLRTSQHHQNILSAYDRQRGVHPDDLAGYLAAELHVRNFVRAELGLEPIVPAGQLTLGDVA